MASFPRHSPPKQLCSPLKLVPFLAVFFRFSASASDGITSVARFTAFGFSDDFFSMNFFTIVDKPGFFDGLDLVRARSDGFDFTSAREVDEEYAAGAGD